jgi:hypothetical protein
MAEEQGERVCKQLCALRHAVPQHRMAHVSDVCGYVGHSAHLSEHVITAVLYQYRLHLHMKQQAVI